MDHKAPGDSPIEPGRFPWVSSVACGILRAMSEENVEIVRSVYEAGGDRERVLALADPDIVVDETRRVFNPTTHVGRMDFDGCLLRRTRYGKNSASNRWSSSMLAIA